MPSNANVLSPALREQLRGLAINEIEATESDRQQALRNERNALLEAYDLSGWIRSDDDGAVLVCHPQEWIVDGTVDHEAIESLDDAIEIPLDETTADWKQIAATNRSVVEQVHREHGTVHGENAAAFATFMNNHRSKLIEHARAADIEEFLTEYYPRNVWPREAAAQVVKDSVKLTVDLATKNS